MKKIFILLLLISTKVHSQTKDTFELVSFPHYDEYGNFYRVVKKYDHTPTRKDSLDFKKESDSTISVMIREVRKEFEPKIIKRKKKP
jgi:hypothetical protein